MMLKAFPISDQSLGIENDVLDTFDGYSPRFHGIHGPDEVSRWFQDAGLTEVEVLPQDTSIRGIKPRQG
jgi:hypothetical protein